MSILAIQSQVVIGHVGNSAAVLPLQRLGFDVWPVPTVVLNYHLGRGPAVGHGTDPDQLKALLDGLLDGNWLQTCRGLLTGYLGSAENGRVVADFAKRLGDARPDVLWLCDPVMGDQHTGFYVAEDLADTFRDRLVPGARIVTPNQFELQWLTGSPIAGLEDAVAACRSLQAMGPEIVLCTSLTAGIAEGDIGTLLVADGVWLAETDQIATALHGAGDLLSALLLGHILAGTGIDQALMRAVQSTFSILDASVRSGNPELSLVDRQDAVVSADAAVRLRRLA